MSKAEEYAAFLYKLHLFQEISEGDLFSLAEEFQEEKYEAGKTILEEGAQARDFYLIYSGKVEMGEGEEKVILVSGDFFGAEELVSHTRDALVQAKDDVVLLVLRETSFETLSGVVEFLKKQLKLVRTCRKLIKEKKLTWLNEGEIIYFLKRKHFILFWKRMFLPILLSFVGAIFMMLWWVGGSNTFWTIGVAALGGAGILTLWYWADWRNDYYIITNQRVIWTEKVIGIYDSRQEANLAEVLSVGANTDAIVQQFFDYGTVSVRVMVGGLSLDYMPHPTYAKHLINELRARTKTKSTRQTKDQIKQAIVDKLTDPNPVATKKRTPAKKKKTFRESFFPKKDRHILVQRYEQGGAIIYRKHWIILLKHAAITFLVTLLVIIYFIYQLFLLFSGRPGALAISAIALVGVGMVIAISILLYQYADWSNDIFKVTKNEIFDIDRKPFGDEHSRSASLKNIESLEYKRQGPLSIFFNFGTVYIHIGADKFEFEDVLDPASVHRDINRRYMQDHHNREEGAAKKERTEMIDWLLTYHQGAEEYQAFYEKMKREKEEAEENAEVEDEE